jgi:uncharacterized small protein (DUF1192 family)
MTYATEATLRRGRIHDGRPASERIAQLEEEVAAGRSEIARLRSELARMHCPTCQCVNR